MSVSELVAPATKRDPKVVSSAISDLAAAFGNRLVTSQAVREQHGHTTTWIPNQPPDAVVFPQSTDDVQQVVRICAKHQVPVIPFGTGTSLEGHVNAPLGGVSIDFRDMNRILAVHAEDLDCVIEPGVTRKQLNEYLRDQGLFFPIDPGADASLGGMAATRASGTNAVRYGTMKDNVLSLKVVLANGEMMTTARRAKKSSAGYDLTRLIVGSEGTLGVITELTLKLLRHSGSDLGRHLPVPVGRGGLQRHHPHHPVRHSGRAHRIARRTAGEGVQRLFEARRCRRQPMLFVEFHGTDAGVAEQAERFGEIAQDLGGGPFEWATKAEDRTRLWQARHDAYWAAARHAAGRGGAGDRCLRADLAAGRMRRPKPRRDAAQSGLVAPIVGHVGDGNFHVTPAGRHRRRR